MTAQTVEGLLTQKGHTVTTKEVKEVTLPDIQGAGAVILGSPSWDFDGKEGMPHEDYVPLIEQLKTQTYEGKPFAIFGLGDSSYTHFCGAVDHLEELVTSMKGKLVTPSLRIDKFFSDQTKHMEAINTWTNNLITALG
jgi:flavodoxin I